MFFPCSSCRINFLEFLKKCPFKGSGRVELATYVCDLHNEVNFKIGKPIFDCSKVLDKWGGKEISSDEMKLIIK